MLVPLEPEPPCVLHGDKGSRGVSIAREGTAVPLWQGPRGAGPHVAAAVAHSPGMARGTSHAVRVFSQHVVSLTF